jgi:hypothetical protein
MAQQRIIGQILEPSVQVRSVLDAGVADGLLDSRFEAYVRANAAHGSD